MTLLLMLVLIGMTDAMSWRISRMEEQAGREVLRQSVRQLGDEMEARIRGDRSCWTACGYYRGKGRHRVSGGTDHH